MYQVRGLDISNMTLVEGDRGVIVIDPLLCAETAAAALALYREHRGARPVTGLIYTHSHADHFGGARGVLPHGTEEGVPVIAPEGFLEHAVSENVHAGNAMIRRAGYMYGDHLPKAPDGQISTGLGPAVSSGTLTLVPPTLDITRTGQTETVDGVRIVFQVTPGTEAPAEMNFLFPDRRALCLAENATHNMHNLLTLRGALVRDARQWARYLDEAIDFFDGTYDVAFASHHWPTWGHDDVVRFLAEQRDLYAYLHDQTLRMLNNGLTGPEIAEERGRGERGEGAGSGGRWNAGAPLPSVRGAASPRISSVIVPVLGLSPVSGRATSPPGRPSGGSCRPGPPAPWTGARYRRGRRW